MLRIPKGKLERAEWIAGLALTTLTIYLHVRCLTHAGPLWRDEANTAAVATRASWAALAAGLEHESFPILPFAVVRVWSELGVGSTDFGLRLLGFLVGAGIVGALWLDSAHLGGRVPLLSLALFALNPVVIRWGDSLRGYGMGTFLFLLVFGAMFAATNRPDRPRIVVASMFAILAVQCMYQNAFVLAAIAIAAVLAARPERRVRVAAAACGIGAVAAASLVPYLGVIARARDHFAVLVSPSDSSRVQRGLLEALDGIDPEMRLAGRFSSLAWLTVCATVVVLGIAFLARRRAEPVAERAACAYGLTALVLAPVAILWFLLRLSFGSSPWYYILLLGAVAVSLDTVSGAASRGFALRTARIVLACGIGAVSIAPAYAYTGLRQTNVDLIARELEKRASPQDLIVVDSWYYGISFIRYYHGPAPWTTDPPLADHVIHRHDLLKAQMMLADPLRPLREQIASTLRSGHVVWVVGFVEIPSPGETPESLPPAPSGTTGWYSGPYLDAWMLQVGGYLRTYGIRGDPVEIPAATPVSPFENLTLFRVDGSEGPR